MQNPILAVLVAASLLASPISAEQHDPAPAAQAVIGDISIRGAFIRATLPRAPVGGAYLTITNAGGQDDRLIGATAPVGRNVEIHEMSMQDGVMSMRRMADGLVIPAGHSVTLDPSGMHLMINGLTERLEEGGTLTLILTFERAGEVAVPFDILALNARRHPDWPAAPGADDDPAEGHAHGAHGRGHDHGPRHDHDGPGFDQTKVDGDEARITGLLKDMFETADSELTVAPLSIEGDVAIIGWSQDGTGGRALLRRDEAGFWRVSICAGAGLKGAANMVQMGVEPEVAARLSAMQAEAEAALTPEHAAQLDMFGEELFFDAETDPTQH